MEGVQVERSRWAGAQAHTHTDTPAEQSKVGAVQQCGMLWQQYSTLHSAGQAWMMQQPAIVVDAGGPHSAVARAAAWSSAVVAVVVGGGAHTPCACVGLGPAPPLHGQTCRLSAALMRPRAQR